MGSEVLENGIVDDMSIEDSFGIGENDSSESVKEDKEINTGSNFSLSEILSKIFGMLFVETGEGSIDSYIDNPLNFDNSKGMAQMIRGITGMLGSTNKAIFDIGLGYLRYKTEKKGVI